MGSEQYNVELYDSIKGDQIVEQTRQEFNHNGNHLITMQYR